MQKASSDRPPAGERQPRPKDPDFEAIYDAVMATERGRWFLSEYARRNRRTDTAMVLAAIERLMTVARADDEAREALLQAIERPGKTGPDLKLLRAGLEDIAAAIARIRIDAGALAPDDANNERAVSEILAAAERIEELAWAIRAQGMDPQVCDRLDGYATAIFAACAREMLAGRRARKVTYVLRFLEARMEGLTRLWDKTVDAAEQAATERTAARRDAVAEDDGMVAPREPVPPAQPQAPTATSDAPPHASAIKPPPPATVWQSTEPAPPAEPVAPDPDEIIADLRAFAAFVMAQCRKDAAPAAGASEPPPAATAPLVADTLKHPAPPCADVPQGPEPPRPGAGAVSDLFADVMALSEEERIALFS